MVWLSYFRPVLYNIYIKSVNGTCTSGARDAVGLQITFQRRMQLQQMLLIPKTAMNNRVDF